MAFWIYFGLYSFCVTRFCLKSVDPVPVWFWSVSFLSRNDRVRHGEGRRSSTCPQSRRFQERPAFRYLRCRYPSVSIFFYILELSTRLLQAFKRYNWLLHWIDGCSLKLCSATLSVVSSGNGTKLSQFNCSTLIKMALPWESITTLYCRHPKNVVKHQIQTLLKGLLKVNFLLKEIVCHLCWVWTLDLLVNTSDKVLFHFQHAWYLIFIKSSDFQNR